MNENNIEGSATAGFGKLQGVAGDALGDHDLQAKGLANEVKGKAQDAVGSAQQGIDKAAVLAKDAVTKVTEQAKETYGRVSDQANAVGDKVKPLVHERPFLALALAGAAGFVLAKVFSSNGPKVIYVKSRN